MRLTASNLVRSIGKLPRKRYYNYINPRNPSRIEIVSVTEPEGPIIIKRYNPNKGETAIHATDESISTQMLWRVANAAKPNIPINIDRILGASYNTRAVLESLLAHTPEFYYAYPGRIESISSSTKIKRGHKHLVWKPESPHKPNLLQEIKTDIVISEIPTVETIYESLTIPEPITDLDIDGERDKVMREGNRPQFKDMKPMFFPYSAVEELYSLCQRRDLKGVTDEFLDCFMEPCLEA